MGLFSDLSPGSTQNYSRLITSIKTRPTKNTNVNVNYTWSHCIGDPVNGFTSAGGAKADQTFSKAFDRRYDHGNCVLIGVDFQPDDRVATPQFANNTLRMIGTGWRLSTIYRHTSGSPLAITTGQDNALTGIAGQRPNQVLGDVLYHRIGCPARFLPQPRCLRGAGFTVRMATSATIVSSVPLPGISIWLCREPSRSTKANRWSSERKRLTFPTASVR